jgi:hypothetical protein
LLLARGPETPIFSSYLYAQGSEDKAGLRAPFNSFAKARLCASFAGFTKTGLRAPFNSFA